MKRFHRVLGIALLVFMFVSVLVPFASASGSLTIRLATSKTAVGPGDTFSVNVNLVGVAAAGGVAIAEVEVRFDNARFTFVDAKIGGGKPAADLMSNTSSGRITLVYLDGKGGSNRYKSDATMATLNFRVRSGASTGTGDFSVALSRNGEGTVGSSHRDSDQLKVTFRGTSIKVNAVAATTTTAGNTNLRSLTVGNATLKPAFNANTTSYTAEVPYDIEQLDLSAFMQDERSRLTFDNPMLKVGSNKVTVTVTASGGAKKTYTITVTRLEDDGEKSDNNDLSELTIRDAELDPEFKPDVLEYEITLPLGTTRARITAKADDEKAKVAISGDRNLKIGVNLATVTVTAEDGTKKEYKITINVDGNEPTTTVPTEPTTTFVWTSPPPTTAPPSGSGGPGFAWWWLVLVAIGGLAAGILLEHFVLPMFDKKRQF